MARAAALAVLVAAGLSVAACTQGMPDGGHAAVSALASVTQTVRIPTTTPDRFVTARPPVRSSSEPGATPSFSVGVPPFPELGEFPWVADLTGHGTASIGPQPRPGHVTIAVSCDTGFLRFVRSPDIDLRVNCVDQSVEIGVTSDRANSRPGRIEAAVTTHWKVSIAIKGTQR